MLGAGRLRARGAERGERVGPVAREGEREEREWGAAQERSWAVGEKEKWASGLGCQLGLGLGCGLVSLFLF